MMKTQIENPILPGFHPDPSVCRVGEDFYLACSSFTFYPGVPVFHSRDLCNWEQIGYALHRTDMVNLNPDVISYGIWAPTIRYHNGLFYLIVGNWSTGEVLLLTAENAAGPWNEKLIDNIGGDPSLFFDEDGRVYCTYSKSSLIHMVEVDADRACTVGESEILWAGSAAKAPSPEASHIYKKNGWYYLLIAEGGTEHYHAVTVARSRDVRGPYESFKANPILTHRHLDFDYPVCNVGHADIVDTPAGDWYMFVLASRLYGGYHKNLGRETFLVPMTWQWDWPVVPSGRVDPTYPPPKGVTLTGYPEPSARTEFDGPLPLDFNTLGTPVDEPYRIADGRLYIKARSERIYKEDFGEDPPFSAEAKKRQKPRSLPFVCRRQEHMSFCATTEVTLPFVTDTETAGLSLMQNRYNALRIELGKKDGQTVLRAVKYLNSDPILGCLPDMGLKREFADILLAEIPWDGNKAVLRIRAEGQDFSLLAGKTEDGLFPVAEHVDGSFMGAETTGGFIGTFVGMFASGNGADSPAEGAFEFFEYIGK